jgi:hypothetical protein
MTAGRVTSQVDSMERHLDARHQARQSGQPHTPFTAATTSQSAVEAVRREEQLLRVWIATLPDELFDDVQSADQAVQRIKRIITRRLMDAARRGPLPLP